jgi:hypothetical protein
MKWGDEAKPVVVLTPWLLMLGTIVAWLLVGAAIVLWAVSSRGGS